jgi:SAM-dependent methyltransferase
MICPRDGTRLEARSMQLVCAQGHEYPVVAGVPVLVAPDLAPTQPGYWSSRSEVERVRATAAEPLAPDEVDPYVGELLVGTHGNLYRGVTVTRYPIPSFPLEPSGGRRLLLDVGCNWGRWSFAAARAGFDVVGVEPSIEAAAAAARIARQLEVSVEFAAADARRLPFESASFDFVFAYSVLQHFARADAAAAVAEMGRVLKGGGVMLVQMANRFGLRNLYNQARRGFREASDFNVRYWSRRELLHVFSTVGEVTLAADGFFTLNPQASDTDLLPPKARAVVRASNALRDASGLVPTLVAVGDSVWVRVEKR